MYIHMTIFESVFLFKLYYFESSLCVKLPVDEEALLCHFRKLIPVKL